jgi:hypothetical protein
MQFLRDSASLHCPDSPGAAHVRARAPRGLTRVPEMLTAFGSLVCRDAEGQQRAVTRAAPLDIWLACPSDEG